MENQIKQLRKKYGLSHGQMAKQIGVDQLQIINTETRNGLLTLAMAMPLAQSLGIPVKEIYSAPVKIDEPVAVIISCTNETPVCNLKMAIDPSCQEDQFQIVLPATDGSGWYWDVDSTILIHSAEAGLLAVTCKTIRQFNQLTYITKTLKLTTEFGIGVDLLPASAFTKCDLPTARKKIEENEVTIARVHRKIN